MLLLGWQLKRKSQEGERSTRTVGRLCFIAIDPSVFTHRTTDAAPECCLATSDTQKSFGGPFQLAEFRPKGGRARFRTTMQRTQSGWVRVIVPFSFFIFVQIQFEPCWHRIRKGKLSLNNKPADFPFFPLAWDARPKLIPGIGDRTNGQERELLNGGLPKH